MDVLVNSEVESVPDRDIQDVFDSICCADDDLVKEAYNEGFEDGKKEGYQEGFSLGVKKGSELSAEIGFYEGFAKGWIALLSGGGQEFHRVVSEQIATQPGTTSSGICSEALLLCQQFSVVKSESFSENQKHIKALNKLLTLAENFQAENSKTEDVVSLINNIRGKFKHCCAILKVEASIPSDIKVSF